MEEDKDKINEEEMDINFLSKLFNYFFPKTVCPHCKKRIIENPLFIVDSNTGEYVRPLIRDKTKKAGWFAVPWYVIIIVLLVVSFSWVYTHDMEQCLQFNNNQCEYCKNVMSFCYQTQPESGIIIYDKLNFTESFE